MKIHFVYAGSPDEGSIQSPYSITKNLYNFFKSKAPVAYYHWTSQDDINAGPDDIVIGHPYYCPSTAIQKFFASGKPCRAKYTIHPLHTSKTEDNMPFDHLTMASDGMFAICGPYWIDTIDSTPFAHWKPKITRLDMAVDLDIWKYRKSSFNDPGNRGIVYIGSDIPNKNTYFIYEIAARLPNVKFRWYGGSSEHPLKSLPNVEIIGWCDFRDKALIHEIFTFADIFLNVSTSDANPTTLLEFGLAGGLIPICTQTSGYWNSPSFINIPLDLDGALNVIHEWLHKPSIELKSLSEFNRSVCEKDYTWERFCNTIWNKISENL